MSLKVALLAFLLASISCQTNERQVEDDLYQCLDQHYAGHNIDLAPSLDSLEDYLIAEDLLKTKDGQGKMDFYKQVVDNGEFPRIRETHLMKTLRRAYIQPESLLLCLKSKPTYDSLLYSQSTFVAKSKNIERDAVSQGVTHIVLVSKAMVTHLTKKDFEHPFYRAQMLISFVMANEGDKPYIQNVPERTQTESSTDCFIIDVSQPQSYLINGVSMEKEAVENSFQEYLTRFHHTTCVQILVSQKTLYSQYAEAHAFVSNSYRSYWNKVSLEEYALPFDQLEPHQQEQITSKYPIRMTEEVVD